MTELDAVLDLLWMLIAHPGTGVLIAVLIAAALIDLRTMRIPNWLTVAAMAYGLLYNMLHGRTLLGGLGTGAAGLLIGLVLLLPLYAIRVMGAGDVKLMAAVGAFLGPMAVVGALLYVVVTGGVLALLYTAARGSLGALGRNLFFIITIARSPAAAPSGTGAPSPSATSVGKFPYGVSICLGTTAYLVVRHFT